MTKAKKVNVNIDFESIQNRLLQNLQYRIDNADNENKKDNLQKEHNAFSGVNALKMIEKTVHLVDYETLIKNVKYIDSKENKNDFIAQYALTKIRRFIYSLANNMNNIDPYSKSILFNLCKLQEITAKSRMVALSKFAEYDALDNVQDIQRKINVALNTADTQASSSKQTFIFLNITTGQKGKRDDTIEFKDNETVNIIKAWFAK